MRLQPCLRWSPCHWTEFEDCVLCVGLLLLLCGFIVLGFGLVCWAPHCFLQLSSASTVCWIARCVVSWVLLGLFRRLCATPLGHGRCVYGQTTHRKTHECTLMQSPCNKPAGTTLSHVHHSCGTNIVPVYALELELHACHITTLTPEPRKKQTMRMFGSPAHALLT